MYLSSPAKSTSSSYPLSEHIYFKAICFLGRKKKSNQTRSKLDLDLLKVLIKNVDCRKSQVRSWNLQGIFCNNTDTIYR